MTNGKKIITTYFVITYLLPMIFNAIFSNHIVSIYKIYPLDSYTTISLFGTYFLYMMLVDKNIFPKFSFKSFYNFLEFIGHAYLKNRLYFAISIFVYAFLNIYLSFGVNDYRYNAMSITERDSGLLLIGILLNSVVIVDLFYSMFIKPRIEIKKFSRVYFENVLLSFSLLAFASGTSSVFMAFLTVLYSLFPNLFFKLIFNNIKGGSTKNIMKLWGSFGVIFFVFILAWLIGEAIKVATGSELTTPIFSDLKTTGFNGEFIKNYFYYLIERLSVYYYSFTFTAENASDVLNNGMVTPLLLPLKTFLFRLDYLLGGALDIQRPEIGSIMQLNYQLLTNELIDPRQGSSPGLLGSFNYIFIFPLNIFFCALYLRWISRMIDVVLKYHGSETLSLLGLFVLLFYVQDFFQSPFDFLIIIDSGILYVALLFIIYLKQYFQGNEFVNLHGYKT